MTNITSLKIRNIGLLLLFFTVLYFDYINVTSIVYGYRGFELNENISTGAFILSFILVGILGIGLSFVKSNSFIYAVQFMVAILFFIPNFIIYLHSTQNTLEIVLSVLLLHICIYFSGKFSFFKKIEINEQLIKNAQKKIENININLLLLFTITLFIPVYLAYGFDLNLNVLLLQEVYDVRAKALDKTNFLSIYTYWWLGNIILPFYILLAYNKRNYIHLFFSTLMMMYIYVCGAHKTILFTLFMVFFLYKGNCFIKMRKLMIFYTLIIFVSMYLYQTTNIFEVEGYFVERVFFIPALLNNFYFDFFNNNYLYLSGSIFKSFIDYPYDLNPAKIIGENYFGDSSLNANNGILSDGFMNFGYLGVLISCVISSLIINLLNSFRINDNYFGLVFVYITLILSSGILTVLFTHGVFFLIIIAWKYLKN